MVTTIDTKKILFTLIGTLLVIYSFSMLGCTERNVKNNRADTTFTTPKSEKIDTPSTSTLPPILLIGDSEISPDVLNADETVTLSIPIKNIGRGDARDLTIHLKSNFQGVLFPQITHVPFIPKKTGQRTVDIPVKGAADLSTGKAKIEIYIEEPHSKQRIPPEKPITVTVDTRKPRTPDLVLFDYAVVEKLSSSPNNRIDVNEEIALEFYVQNKGTGTAEEVEVRVENNQTGVKWLSEANETGHKITIATFPNIAPGKSQLISSTYFVNTEFTDEELIFKIIATEKHGKYGFSETKAVAINSGNTVWILLLIGVCCVSFIIWERLRKSKQTRRHIGKGPGGGGIDDIYEKKETG